MQDEGYNCVNSCESYTDIDVEKHLANLSDNIMSSFCRSGKARPAQPRPAEITVYHITTRSPGHPTWDPNIDNSVR